jgi:hypothetical protein
MMGSTETSQTTRSRGDDRTSFQLVASTRRRRKKRTTLFRRSCCADRVNRRAIRVARVGRCRLVQRRSRSASFKNDRSPNASHERNTGPLRMRSRQSSRLRSRERRQVFQYPVADAERGPYVAHALRETLEPVREGRRIMRSRCLHSAPTDAASAGANAGRTGNSHQIAAPMIGSTATSPNAAE